MKIVILTTCTLHHIYFVKKISEYYDISSILVEKESLTPSFNTFHSFEDKMSDYERKELLNNEKLEFDNFSNTLEFKNINDKACVKFISREKPDIIISFGTGIIKKRIIEKCKEGIINLHGGDPQFYRGLDSHLWAIYHKDFSQLKVCLHKINQALDDGEIIGISSIKIKKNLELFMLRSENTKLCVDLTLSALKKFDETGFFEFSPQKSIGRYYSFMPNVLKEICLTNFNLYVKNL
ncbi:MAG: hypothetical protein CBE24_03790 [bacterium TMED264]|nr:MAG: hypothetical protein CBE24_03790 [bacterium TMED264]